MGVLKKQIGLLTLLVISVLLLAARSSFLPSREQAPFLGQQRGAPVSIQMFSAPTDERLPYMSRFADDELARNLAIQNARADGASETLLSYDPVPLYTAALPRAGCHGPPKGWLLFFTLLRNEFCFLLC